MAAIDSGWPSLGKTNNGRTNGSSSSDDTAIIDSLPSTLPSTDAKYVALNPFSAISILPDEILIHSLANLDPYHLRLAASVCKRWNTVINDDACWRTALEFSLKSLPSRRVSKASWRMEYLRRHHLQKEWQRVFGKRVVQFDPRIGRIHCAFVEMDDEAPRMIVGSIDRGMAAVCNSTTGKVEKDIIYFNSDQLPMEIADLLFDRSRLFAGFLNGGVAMVSNVLSRSGMPQLRTFLGFHQGPVTKIASIPNQHNTLLSGGADGEVRVWNVSSGRSAAVCQGNTSPITSIVMDPKQFVAAGTMNGKIHVWVLDASTLKQSATPVSGLTIPNMTPDNVVSVSRTLDHFSSIQATGTRPIVNLLLDTTLSILISLCECKASDAGSAVRIWNVATGAEAGVRLSISNLTSAGNAQADGSINRFALPKTGSHYGAITSIQWDRPTFGPTDRKTSILVSGDEHGRICLWELSDSALQATSSSIFTVYPLRTIQAHPSPIFTIQMDPFKIITGSSTGSIKVFDITTSQLLQNLSLRRGAEVGDIHNAGGALDNRSISFVWSGEWRLIAIANGSIRSWDFRPNSGAGASVSSTGGKAKRRAARNRFDATRAGARANGSVNSSSSSLASRMISPKGQLSLDMRSEMRDYEIEQRQERKLESRREKERLKMQGRVNGTEVSGLSEEELLNYAMMLSMEQSHASLPSASSPDAFIPLDEAEAVAIAESLSLASLPPSAPSPSLSASPASLSSSLPNDLPNFSLPPTVPTPSRDHPSSTAWYEDDWDFDRDVDVDSWAAKHLLANDAPVSSKRHSLTIPIGGSTPTAALSSTPPFSTPLSYAAVAHRRTPGSSSSSTSSLNEWSDDEGEPESATPSGRRFVFGTIGGGNAPMVLRSPRLGPGVGTHVSPRLGPGSGVVVAPRRTERDEEEEMMYVLELSLLEK